MRVKDYLYIAVLIMVGLLLISSHCSDLKKTDPEASAIERTIVVIFIIIIALILLAWGWFKKQELISEQKDKNKRLEECTAEKNKKQKEYTEKKHSLLQTGNYKYVANYVHKYKEFLFEDRKLKLFEELLEEKGHQFNRDEIILLVNDERLQQEYEAFREVILRDNPVELDDYISTALSSYGENYADYIDKLTKLINEKKWTKAVTREIVQEHLDSSMRTLERRHFENQIKDHSSKVPSIEEIDLMNGEEFEIFLEHLFTKMGFSVERTRYTQDQGADLVIRKFGEISVVQAKRFNQLVGNGAIQEVVASIKHYNAEKGIVVTTNQFTRSAIELAASNKVTLIDRSELIRCIARYY
jgi:HJR/Mrr/RecB family endonuclease